MQNLILNTDSYKTSHFVQYPEGAEYVSSYIESRGGVYPATVFFGLQMFIKQYLTKPITLADIDEADEICALHGVPFNRKGWLHILNAHNGFLPLHIEAVPEGNPAPQRFDGKLLPFQCKDLGAVLSAVLNNRFTTKAITMAQAELNDGQTLLAVNDLYIGPKLPISARYELEHNGKREVQSSSGVLVSTGLGSTGWLRSLITGAAAISQVQSHPNYEMPWNSPELCYCVREPFPSQTTGTSLVFGRIEPSQHFSLTSRMAEGGIIFSDGIVDDAIEFNSGTIANIAVAKIQGRLVSI